MKSEERDCSLWELDNLIYFTLIFMLENESLAY